MKEEVSKHPQAEDYTELIPGANLALKMVAIPGGSYLAGSPVGEAGHEVDEGPMHQVNVDAFWMSSIEISWDIYEQFLYRTADQVKSTNYGQLSLGLDAVSGATMPYVNFNKPGYPVIDITQYAASTFCKWLSAKTGRFYRLPTEAEWEYACRAGSTEAYSFGEQVIDDYAWYDQNSGGTAHKSGLKKPNPYGLYDMHGNVAEWVLDSYDAHYYDLKPTMGEQFLSSGTLYPRVVRGGAFNQPKESLRSAARDFSSPKWKKRDPQFPKSLWWLTDASHVGFRVVSSKKIPNLEVLENYWGVPIEEY
ncbi:MAG: SUMF1/EgtB/PvdO family nonheme iron enzyme [Flammeovirgaceae bacterium]|nr:SUMF1/EgtB/PvdO family nonheme iron enzyme [Flammeovirgaceae bacterium]